MGNTKFDAYLFFIGNAKEAMEYYQSIFGGKLDVMMYDEIPDGDKPPNSEGKIMNAMLTGGHSFMGADSTRKVKFGDSFISLSLNGSDEEKLRHYFEKLSEGGKVEMPMKNEFWVATFSALGDYNKALMAC
jgi:PhnB protein